MHIFFFIGSKINFYFLKVWIEFSQKGFVSINPVKSIQVRFYVIFVLTLTFPNDECVGAALFATCVTSSEGERGGAAVGQSAVRVPCSRISPRRGKWPELLPLHWFFAKFCSMRLITHIWPKKYYNFSKYW